MPSANALKQLVSGIEVCRVERISQVLELLMSRDLKELRRDYQFGQLLEDDAGENPIVLFEAWLSDAKKTTARAEAQ